MSADMTPERWQEVKSVLATVLEIDPGEREAYLERSCAGDVSLRREVERLIPYEQSSDSEFLNRTAVATAASTVLREGEGGWIGRQVGPYRILAQLGAGGMGEVYRARRADDQYRQEVAVKIVRAGDHSGVVIGRFRNERQIVASLEHPNIARLLDGGTTDDGTPYFVMELIEGRSMTDYCDTHGLGVTERLNLFSQVCAAVEYAHQRLIVHRDIKPANILVTADGTPKLLDFGIAKILDFDSAASPAATLTAFRILTPRYASPEQIRGEPITTASDVYSLGVVLYELLTGQSPYGSVTSSPQEIAQAACESDPLRPSAVVQRAARASNGGDSIADEGIHQARKSGAEKLHKRLTGDLDNIVLMAVRKEPARRYASVEQLKEDIRRHLEHLPVLARKDTFRYRTSKFVFRNSVAVVASVAVALALLAGIAISLHEASIARVERARAERRFNDVRKLANSLVFDVHDSIKDLPGATPARKIIVDRALEYLNGLAQESAGDLQLQRELATAYEKVGAVQGDYLEHNLGDSVGTLASYHKALDLRQHIAAASSDWTDRLALAVDYRLVAHQMWANGDPRGARDPINRAMAMSEALNTAVPNNSTVLYELAFDYEVSGRIGFPGDATAKQKALHEYRRAVALDEILLKAAPNDLRLLHGYTIDLSYVGTMLEATDPQEALHYYQKELEINQKLTQLSPDLRYRRGVAMAHGSMASVYDDIGDSAHSVENNIKDLEIYQGLVSADPKNVLLQQGLAIVYINTASSCSRAGKTATALDYSNRGLEIMRRLVASAPEKAFQRGVFAAMLLIRGTVLTAANQAEAAIPEIERGRSIYESLAKTGATNVANVAASDVKLGEAALKAGHDQKAADSFHQALTVAEPLISTDPPDLDALYAAADAYSGLGELSMKSAIGRSAKARKSSLTEAQSCYQSSLNAWHRIQHPNHTAPNSFQAGDPAIVAQKLKRTEATLSALR